MNDAMYGTELTITVPLRLSAQNGGLCISRGIGTCRERMIESHELIFVAEGCLNFQEGGRTFEVNTGETLLLFPHRRHGGTNEYPPDLKYYWIHFTLTGDGSKDLKRKSLGPENEGISRFTVPQHTIVKNQERLLSLFRWFLDAQETKELQQIEADMLVYLMLFEVSNSFS